MKKGSLFILMLICLSTVCCKKKIQSPTSQANADYVVVYPNKGTAEMKNRILELGDSMRYNDLFECYRIPEEFPYAWLLANKYHYSKANLEVYSYLYRAFGCPELLDVIQDSLTGYFTNEIEKFEKMGKLNPRVLDSISNNGEPNFFALLVNKGYYDKLKYRTPDLVNNQMAIRCLREASEKNTRDALGNYSAARVLGVCVAKNRKEGIRLFRLYRNYVEKPKNKDKRETLKKVDNNNHNHQPASGDATYVLQKVRSIIPNQTIDTIMAGDTLEYNKLKAYYLPGYPFELLFFSIIMADRYNYKPAYFDVYLYLWATYNFRKKRELWDTSQFDEPTKQYALYHLKKSAIFGDKRAIRILNKVKSSHFIYP